VDEKSGGQNSEDSSPEEHPDFSLVSFVRWLSETLESSKGGVNFFRVKIETVGIGDGFQVFGFLLQSLVFVSVDEEGDAEGQGNDHGEQEEDVQAFVSVFVFQWSVSEQVEGNCAQNYEWSQNNQGDG